jgi:tetratricopeptide (TPR) repeat protein
MVRVATLCMMGVLLAAPARGDELAQEAGKHREAATKEFAEGKFAEALQDYRTAYQLVIDPDLLFNIGLCQESLHDNAGAVESYQKFLAARPGAKDRPEIEARIAALKGPAAPAPAPAPAQVNLAPPPAAVAPAPAPAPAPADTTPFYKRWYTWAAVGAVVVVAAVITGIALSLRSSPNFTFDGVVAR